MSLTQVQISLVKSTFELVAPHAPAAAAAFYARLFEVAPQFRPLFMHSMDEQGKKLMEILAVAVRNLDNLGAIIPAVQALGARHVGYGVKAEDYAIVGGALLWTLETSLGDVFTAEAKEAWATAYDILAQTAIGENYPVMA